MLFALANILLTSEEILFIVTSCNLCANGRQPAGGTSSVSGIALCLSERGWDLLFRWAKGQQEGAAAGRLLIAGCLVLHKVRLLARWLKL